nr:sarcosine oxidase subunit gamma [Shimia sp. R11_0]
MKAITPLGKAEPAIDCIGALTITEVVDRAMASVASREGQTRALRQKLFEKTGLSLPEVSQSTQANPYAAFWSGPNQWMITAAHDDHEGLAAELKSQLGDCASVVEQTDGWCWFEVSGDTASSLFERLTNAPLREMQNGTALRTTLEHLSVFIWRFSADRVAVIGPRSSAGSLHHALVAAAKSIA